MAARQFPPDRRAGAHRQAPPAQGLQPRAAAPAGGTVGRAAARLRPRARSDRARRWPARRGKPAALRRRVSERRAARPGRALGRPHHAAPGADREPAARGRAHRRQHRRAQPRRHLGRAHDRDRRARCEEPDPRHRGHGALEPADDQLLRRRARAPPAGPGRRARAAAHLDRAAPCGARPDHRAAGARADPGAGRRPGVDGQQHRQPAPARRNRLARVRRGAERGRAGAARGCGLRRDGFRHPRPLSPRGREHGQGKPALGRRGGARGDAHGNGGRRACRRLPDRRGPPGAGARGAGAAHVARHAAPEQPPSRRHPLSERDCAGHGHPHRVPLEGRVHRGHEGLDAAARRTAGGASHQPARGGARQPPGQRAGGARSVAADGLLARHPAAVAHPGRGAGDAGGRGADRPAGGGAGGALPRQPRRQPALRAAHRLPGRGPGNAAGGRGAGAGRARRHRRAQPQVPQRRALLPLPSPAALESRRAPLDGLRAQARQALAAQCLPARRPHGSLFARGRGDGGAAHGEVRDHARHRHAAAARRGAPAGRRHGAPAQPSVRDSAAAHGGQPARHQPVALCAAVRRGARHRPVHAGGLRRVSGPVRRRLVHRQGHLRCRRVRARARGALPREPHPQPRSARRLLCALRPAERRGAVRGISVALQRGREPPPPLDPRRLADRALVAAARAGGRRSSAQESALVAVAVEDSRQPAPQRRARRTGGAAVRRLDGGDARDRPGTRLAGIPSGGAAQARRRAAAPALHLGDAFVGAPSRAGGIHARVPPVRGVLQPGRDPANGEPHAGHPYAAAGVDALRRGADRWRLLLPIDVDRAGGRHRRRAVAERFESSRARARGTGSPPLARLARHRLVDQPSARAPGSAA